MARNILITVALTDYTRTTIAHHQIARAQRCYYGSTKCSLHNSTGPIKDQFVKVQLDVIVHKPAPRVSCILSSLTAQSAALPSSTAAAAAGTAAATLYCCAAVTTAAAATVGSSLAVRYFESKCSNAQVAMLLVHKP
eukprot:10567-Heterococcus_DN1.PRE.2